MKPGIYNQRVQPKWQTNIQLGSRRAIFFDMYMYGSFRLSCIWQFSGRLLHHFFSFSSIIYIFSALDHGINRSINRLNRLIESISANQWRYVAILLHGHVAMWLINGIDYCYQLVDQCRYLTTQPHSHLATQLHRYIVTEPFSHIDTQPQGGAAFGYLHKGGLAFRRDPCVEPFVAMWLCGHVALWLRSHVATWLYGCVAMWLCGYVAMWLCDYYLCVLM